MKKITKDMKIQEIFYNCPDKTEEISNILRQAGLNCLGCAIARFESLEQGLLAHGKTPKEIKEIISRLNSAI